MLLCMDTSGQLDWTRTGGLNGPDRKREWKVLQLLAETQEEGKHKTSFVERDFVEQYQTCFRPPGFDISGEAFAYYFRLLFMSVSYQIACNWRPKQSFFNLNYSIVCLSSARVPEAIARPKCLAQLQQRIVLVILGATATQSPRGRFMIPCEPFTSPASA